MSQGHGRVWRIGAGAILAGGVAVLLFAATAASAAISVNGASARLQWAPASGPVAGYSVQVSRNGSAWSALQNVFRPSVTVVFPPGVTVRVRVAAYDAQGRTGPWSAASQTFQFAPASGGSAGVSAPSSAGEVARYDLNGDGYADLIWRIPQNGSYHVWYMRGTAAIGSAVLASPSDPAARLAGVADFNGDGHPDILFFDPFNGAGWVSVYRGKNARNLVGLPAAPAGWDVAAVGQFDGRNSADILLRNASSGANLLWRVSSNLSVQPLALPGIDPIWKDVTALDYDGDGTTDLMWREPVSGSNVVWKFRAGRITEAFFVDPVVSAWTVAAVGDFDGDGAQDILWRAPQFGDDVIWFGGSQPFERRAGIPWVHPAWWVGGAADVDGSGRADIVWTAPSTGQAILWTMNGASVSRASLLASTPVGWVPISPD